MKYLIDINKGILIKKMSMIGAVMMIIVGINSLTNIFSSITTVGLTSEDMKMLEEMLGGQVANFIVDLMPSKMIQFQSMVLTSATSLFSGIAFILGGAILLCIRSKINKVLEEQEVISYGGENFTDSNQC